MPRAFANYTLHDRSKSQIVVWQSEPFFTTGLLADSYVICLFPRSYNFTQDDLRFSFGAHSDQRINRVEQNDSAVYNKR